MVYTRVYSSPFLCRLLPFFLGNMCWSRGDLSPEYLHCVLWGAYTVCSGELILCALGSLYCVLWGVLIL